MRFAPRSTAHRPRRAVPPHHRAGTARAARALRSRQIILTDADGQLSICARRGADRGTNADQPRASSVDPTAIPLFRTLITHQQSLLVADTRQHPQWQDWPDMELILSWFGVPLRAGGELIGLCSIEQTE